MTREETVQVLSLLKAAYPNAYKGMTRQEGNGVIAVWSAQFSNVPVEVVLLSINKLISTNTFPPSISEVKAKFKDLYWECFGELAEDNTSHHLTEAQRNNIKRIMDTCYEVKEPSVSSLIGCSERRMLDEAHDK